MAHGGCVASRKRIKKNANRLRGIMKNLTERRGEKKKATHSSNGSTC